MRAGIRQKLLDNVLELKDCYEPTIPSKSTIKPYAVILQGPDNDESVPTSFKRTIEVWLYEKRTTFQKLDSLTNKVIKALDLQTVEDANTLETFTCMFEGGIGQDIIDEEWDAIARGLQFSVIALHEEEEITGDAWVEALSIYTENSLKLKTYRDTWKKNFQVPSALWRTLDSSREIINCSLFKLFKTMRCHIVSNNKSDIEQFLDTLENKLIIDSKIPLNLSDRRYLTIESIKEDRSADMLDTGQLTITLSRLQMIEENTSVIEKIYSRHNIE